jgi:hypothetical protein
MKTNKLAGIMKDRELPDWDHLNLGLKAVFFIHRAQLVS